MMKCAFANLYLNLPSGWIDVTDDLPSGSPPTLSRGENAIGALQFSAARYTKGVRPCFDRQTIQALLREFEVVHHFPISGLLHEFQNSAAKTFGVWADYSDPDQFTRVWYVSDGDNLSQVTFVTLQASSSDLKGELLEAQQVVESISF